MKLILVSAVLALLSSAAGASDPTYPDLVYATLGSQALHLDLYLPTTGSAPYPLWIFIHGGGWSSGNKFPLHPESELALASGFAVASLDYRLTSQAAMYAPFSVTFPAQIHDLKGAVRWLRAHASTYGLDPARFIAFGPSAGGHLAALLTTSKGVSALEGTIGGNLGTSSAVQAGIDYFGPNDLLHMEEDVLTPPGSTIAHDAPNSPEAALIGWNGPGQGFGDIKLHLTDPTPPYPALVQLIAQATPQTWVDPSDPPMFIGHGTHDTLVPVNQSSKLSAKLFAAGVSHDFRAVPNAGHGLGPGIDPIIIAFAQEKLLGPQIPDAGTPFCAGDGSAAACPCNNASQAGAKLGCRHSVIIGGNLNAIGKPSVSADTLVLRGDSMPDTPCLYLQGATQLAGGNGTLFGDGLLCVGNPIVRLAPKLNALGWSSFPENGDPLVSVRGAVAPGVTRYYQIWFRDSAAYCTPIGYNLTNALAVTWLP